jgi:tetratricopeptide (TPR) repeat protein
MFIRLNISILLAPLTGLLLTSQAFCAPVDDWDALILQGSHDKFEGKYDSATQSFNKAVSLAEKQKLADKCLPISLCRLAEAELFANNVKEADSHFEQITNLISSQKQAHKLDPQVNFWAVALADAYLTNHEAETKELCLKHACYLKTLVYGAVHRECTNCLTKLADCYIGEDKVDKAMKILEMREGLLTKQLGKDADRYGDAINSLALKCENGHMYKQAKELEQVVVDIAKTNTGSLNAGFPAFYTFLGMNAMAQGKKAESREAFTQAIRECSKINDFQRKQWACKYLDPLVISLDNMGPGDSSINQETVYKTLLSAYQKMTTGPDLQYHILLALSRIIGRETEIQHSIKRTPEVKELLTEAISINERPGSSWKSHLPSLYIALACCDIRLGNYDQAQLMFTKALDIDPNKTNFHRGTIYLQWGAALECANQWELARAKFNSAFKIASSLTPRERGTLLADLLQKLAIKSEQSGDLDKARHLFEQSSAEIKLQKKLNSKLGPDMFHRM